MLLGLILSVIMFSVVMLDAALFYFMLSVIMMNVVAP